MSEPTSTPIPSLTQPQREAVFDFLLLGMYADGALKLSENERIYEIVSGLGWESYQDPTEYSELATARVRKASETEAGTREFLAALSGRLENEDAKTFALALLLRLLEADNQVVESEQSFHAAAKAAFGI